MNLERFEPAIHKIRQALAICLSCYQLYTAMTRETIEPMQQRAIYLVLLLTLVFLRPRENKKYRWVDLTLAGLSAWAGLYIVVNVQKVITRWPGISPVSNLEMFLGFALAAIVVYVTWRTVSRPLSYIAVFFLVYAYVGPYLPKGMFWHPGLNLRGIIDLLYLSYNGIYGVALNAAVKYILTFMLFGAFLNNAGGGEFFTKLANAIAGHARGGPAKVAIIASSLFGTISGSPTANVVTTGTVTIPLMKKIGYSPAFAGAVEAAASTGGSIMPPVMGTAAFLMAEYTGISYGKICIAAVIPAVLYYLSLFAQVDFRAARRGLGGLPKESLPRVGDVLKEGGHFIVPLVVITYCLFMGMSAPRSACIGILSIVLVSWLRPHTRMTLRKIIDALIDAPFTAAKFATSGGTIGIVVCMLMYSGLAGKLSGYAMEHIGTSPLLILLLQAVVTILLGMGVTTTATYLVAASIVAPSLVMAGFSLISVHMFVFYYAVLSAITPPVMVACFAAAGLAEAEPMRTGYAAMRLSLVAFIIPFMFIFQPALLMEGPAILVLRCFATAAFGVLALSAGFEGWFKVPFGLVPRILMVTGGLCMIDPSTITDVIGFGSIVAALLLIRFSREWKERNTVAAA